MNLSFGRKLVIVLLAFQSSFLLGQQYFFKQFSISEGLAQSTVYKVIQDRNDVYWLGTQAGVSAFVGTEFENYSSANGLAENGVRSICEDKSGQLWFGHTGGGVSRYRDQAFEVLHLLDTLISSNVTSIVEDSAAQIWISTEGNGILQISNPQEEAEKLSITQYSGNKISDRVFSAVSASNGTLYFVADPNVKAFDPEKRSFRNVVIEGIPKYYQTTCIVMEDQGDAWVGKYNGGLYHFDAESGEVTMYDLIKMGMASNFVTSLFRDRQGNTWAGTWEGGLARIDANGELHVYIHQNGLPGMKIWSIMQDREDNILIGTHDNGLCVFMGERFVNYFPEDGLMDSQVWSVLQRRSGEFWFGTGSGISILSDGPDGPAFKDFHKLEGERVSFLKEDNMGNIWIGANGVFTYDRKGVFSFDPMINALNRNLTVSGMDIDRDNNLWIGTMEGLIYYEIEQRRVSRLSQENGLSGNDISTVYADSKGRIWVGSYGRGINLIQGDSIRSLDLGFAFTPRCFLEDQDGNIWVGTEGRGVILYDPAGESLIRTLELEDGLLANLINQLLCDSYNNVYIGTNKGLNIYQRSDEKIYAYTSGSGFVGIETKPNATLMDDMGRLWFGTVDGVTCFRPEEGALGVKEPLTKITSVQVNHEEVSLEEGQRFSHKQNSFIFEYRNVTLNPDALRYQIMLEGIDSDWREPGTHNSVTYPALRHGKYSFRVKARSSEGVWNSEAVSFHFEIRPPIYLTWYFILGVIILISLLIFLLIKIRERALKRENIILENKVIDRTAIVVAQKEELAQRNKDITDSIRYAKRIQFAILPENPPFKDTFVLFKPKAIVSGDFYWFQELEGRQFMAAVDCTGHGVPGAFMSIIGHNSLTKIVREYGILDPGRILTELNREVVSTLHKRSDAGEVLDGMDLALACYIPERNIIEFAGAFNPLYLIRNGELIEIKADKVSIGRSSLGEGAGYLTREIELQAGDSIYMFSDGYADQFGGELMKKFKYRNLKDLFLRIQNEPMTRQGEILDRTLEEWKGNLDQLDDILVLGRRF